MKACEVSCGDIDYTIFFDVLVEEDFKFCMVCGGQLKIGGESEIDCGRP